MIERWSIDKCIAIRTCLNITLQDVGSRVGWSRQAVWNIEHIDSNKDKDATMRTEILYTLALKDILEERGLVDINQAKEQFKKSVESRIADLQSMIEDLQSSFFLFAKITRPYMRWKPNRQIQQQ